MNRNTVLAIGAAVAIVATGVVLSQFASSEPDGLEYVAQQQGFDDAAQDHTLSESPLADYGENLGADSGLSTAVAGLVGLIVTGVLTVGVFWLARSRRREPMAKP
jgi:hypothetical protein